MAEAEAGSTLDSAVLIALVAAAAVAQADPTDPADAPGGVRAGPVGAVVQGLGQGAGIAEPRFRPSDRPAWGRHPEPCTVVSGSGNRVWQYAGCVYVANGFGNTVNGKMFEPGSMVCIGWRRHPKICKHNPVLDRLPQVHLPRLP